MGPWEAEVMGASLGIQWLKFHVPNAGGPGSTPGQGTRSSRPQLKSLHAAETAKIPRAATKSWRSLINK